MEEFRMEYITPLAASDPNFGGGNSGSADAPVMPDFGEEVPELTDIKLW